MENTKKQKNRTRALIISVITIIICLALLAGGTYALWSKSVTVENHLLVSGKMDLTLERISLKKTALDSTTGYMKTYAEDTNVVDLTNPSASKDSVNVFGFDETNGELVVPTSSYEAKLKITNKGDVAFSYEVRIKLDKSLYDEETYTYTAYGEKLAQQLQVTVYDAKGDQKVQKYLSDFDVTAGTVVIDKVYVQNTEATSTFGVKVEFVDDTTDTISFINNEAMSKKVSFDLLVSATQATSAPAQD